MKEIVLKGTISRRYKGATDILVDGWVKVSLPYHLHEYREGTEVEVTLRVSEKVQDEHGTNDQ